MFFFKKKITVVTHSGTFHADDVFACATISLWAEKNNFKLKIIRDRDKQIIKKADIVVDVGMEYDQDANRFDHHQKGGAGIRDNKIPFASFGLVWKKYGKQICEIKEIADRIENNLVIQIDAADSGVRISLPNEFGIYDHRTGGVISNFNPAQQEKDKTDNEQFDKALYFAKEIIKREIAWAIALDNGEKETSKAILEQNEPKILILNGDIEWHEAVSKNKNVKIVIYLHKNGKNWCVQTGRDDLEDYNSDRANMPKSWWGLRGEELVGISGIKDASFCTNGGWFATANSKEGAVEMAKKAEIND